MPHKQACIGSSIRMELVDATEGLLRGPHRHLHRAQCASAWVSHAAVAYPWGTTLQPEPAAAAVCMHACFNLACTLATHEDGTGPLPRTAEMRWVGELVREL